jgi:branched-subunit amino acid transport protein
MTLVAVLAIAVGTYAFRLAGPLLRDRVELSERMRTLLSSAALVLLVALIATASLMDGRQFAGVALPAGVLVGGVLAARKAPFVVVVIAAAASTAGLRLLGVA